MAAGEPERRSMDSESLRRAQRIVDLAWRDLPPNHRLLLQNVRADSWEVTDPPLGLRADELLQSAGQTQLTRSQRAALDRALGVWIDSLRVILIDAGHQELRGLNDQAYEAVLVRVAWHEWAHALSIARSTSDDVAAGARLLELAPQGVRVGIRSAGYRRNEYTHELVAETYALLMARRRRGQTGQPAWLDAEIYTLVRRVCGWAQ
jgi:hypothetical protein